MTTVAQLKAEIKDLIPKLKKDGQTMVESFVADWDKVRTLKYSVDELRFIKKLFAKARADYEKQQQLLRQRREDKRVAERKRYAQ